MLQKDLCQALQFEVTYSMLAKNLNIHNTQFTDVSFNLFIYLWSAPAKNELIITWKHNIKIVRGLKTKLDS